MISKNTLERASCWILTEGMAGTENQCIALVSELGLEANIKRLSMVPELRWAGTLTTLLPPKLLVRSRLILEPPWPDLLIASGRKCVGLALAIRRASKRHSFVVFVQNPRWGFSKFDLIIAPQHDDLNGENVITTMGALSRVNRGKLETAKRQFQPAFSHLPHPLIACLIGGSSRYYNLTPERAAFIGKSLADFSLKTGASFLITSSRRTPLGCLDALKSALTETPVYIWDSKGENPYLGFLGSADAIFVTEDSVSMISDACTTGKPVYTLSLERRRPNKIEKFIDNLENEGAIRPFSGNLQSWEYAPLRDTAIAAGEVLKRYLTQKANPLAGYRT